jgi:hypothetical protein
MVNMTTNTYQGNLPSKTTVQNATVQAFDTYFSKPLELDANTFALMQGFFESQGFSKTSAETIAVVIIKQAKKDGYNPLTILDTLKSLNGVELSSLVSEILNYNRFKTSQLGYAGKFVPNLEIARNIVA